MTPTETTYTVGALARLAGVTVRSLHHYEDIGLLVPHTRSTAGYRLYDAGDADRLTRILYYRDLDFGLDQIAVLLDGETDPVDHLRTQHRLLTERLATVRRMVTAVEREMEARMSGMSLTPEEQLEIFGETWGPEYRVEAEERWGDTDAWAQSQARTAAFTKEDWRQVKADADALDAEYAAAFTAGVRPGSPEANALAERHRAALGRFYDTDHNLQRKVASLLTDDERFGAPYERRAPGLAAWIRAIVDANADQQG